VAYEVEVDTGFKGLLLNSKAGRPKPRPVRYSFAKARKPCALHGGAHWQLPFLRSSLKSQISITDLDYAVVCHSGFDIAVSYSLAFTQE